MEKKKKNTSPFINLLIKFIKNPTGLIGLIGFILLVLTVVIGSIVVPFDPYYQQGVMKNVKPGSGYLNIPSKLVNEGIKDIDSGITFSAGLSNEGKVYLWGIDAVNEKYTKIPSEIFEKIKDKKIAQVACGDKHVLLLTETGDFYGFGNDSFNQLKIPADMMLDIRGEGIKKIAAGDQYSVVLTKDGNINIWGSTLVNKLDVIPSNLKRNVKDFAVGAINVLVITNDGKIQLLGAKGSQLENTLPEELKVGSNSNKKVKHIAITQDAGVAITENDELYVWGSNNNKGLDYPKELDNKKIIKIEAGRTHFTALTEDGEIYSWGNDFYGETKSPKGNGFKDIYSGFFANYAVKDNGKVEKWGLNGFLFGTDELGRDIFVRLIHGGKVTMGIALIAVVIQVVLGVIVGVVSGYYGGVVDNLLMRFSEIIASFPFYPLVITLSAALPVNVSQNTRLFMIMFILGILGWTGIARLIRGQILAEREKEYVLSAKSMGIGELSIMLNHIFPNVISIVIVQATLGYAGNLLTEASLSFLGFGVKVPFPSWGNMLNSAQETTVIQYYWWRWLIPGLTVFFAVILINLIGDALRDAMDPKSN